MRLKLSEQSVMPGKKTKLIFDTNIWISFLISDRLKYLDNNILGADIQLVFSEELIEEFIIVSRRAKFAEF
jgi:putative PIN family toxin of toxin-antitoxin system